MEKLQFSLFRTLYRKARKIDRNPFLKAFLCRPRVKWYDPKQGEWEPIEQSKTENILDKFTAPLFEGGYLCKLRAKGDTAPSLRGLIRSAFRKTQANQGPADIGPAFAGIRFLDYNIEMMEKFGLSKLEQDQPESLPSVELAPSELSLGSFLISHPRFIQPCFGRCVMLVVETDNQGDGQCYAYIVNKPLDVTFEHVVRHGGIRSLYMAAFMPAPQSMTPPTFYEDDKWKSVLEIFGGCHIYIGGPVVTDLTLLHSCGQHIDPDAVRIGDTQIWRSVASPEVLLTAAQLIQESAAADSHDAVADSHDAAADSADSHDAAADSHDAAADSNDAAADSHDAAADSHDADDNTSDADADGGDEGSIKRKFSVADFKMVTGTAAWSPGQLSGELEDNTWTVAAGPDVDRICMQQYTPCPEHDAFNRTSNFASYFGDHFVSRDGATMWGATMLALGGEYADSARVATQHTTMMDNAHDSDAIDETE